MAGSIPILRVGGNLLVTVQTDLHDAVADVFQEDLLSTIERTGASGLLIDVSGLDIVDSYVARVLVDTAKMAKLMGTATVIVGIRPEVAATLVRMGFAMTGVRTALNIDEGLVLLPQPRKSRAGS
jgi:rsbT antagonist protein RsbS